MRFRNGLAAAALAAAFSGMAQPSVAASLNEPPAAESAAGFSASEAGERRYELTYSGRRFDSRDGVDGYLLYRSALLTRQQGYSWFLLLHLPGERGPNAHPARPNPSFGADYGHWQPHWSYYRSSLGWQPWHPEWGAPFWADEPGLTDVERVEAHAMIEMGRRNPPPDAQTVFDAERVTRDLRPFVEGREP